MGNVCMLGQSNKSAIHAQIVSNTMPKWNKIETEPNVSNVFLKVNVSPMRNRDCVKNLSIQTI